MAYSRGTDRHRGTVTEFDAARGLGTVAAGDGSELMFHCVEIADGTRVIELGAEVTFVQMAKFGALEAADLRPA